MRRAVLMLPAMLMTAGFTAPPAPAPARPAAAPAGSEELRGWWLEDSRSGDQWLVDEHTRWDTGWLIKSAGGYQARGFAVLPKPAQTTWLNANGSRRYRCVRMQVRLDRRNRQITRIYWAKPAPASECRTNRRLPQPPRSS
jgi:hypothetical protein